MELKNGSIFINGIEVNDPELIFYHLKDLAENGKFKLMAVEPVTMN